MKRKILSGIIAALLIGSTLPLTASALTCTNTYPTTLNSYVNGSCIPSAWANALEAKLGINQSTSTTSLDYELNSIFTSYASEIVKATSTQGLLQTVSNLSDLISTSTARQNLGANATYLKIASSGADIVSTSTFRTSLGLLSAALQNASAFLNTANNLSDLPSTSTARTNLGLGNLSTQNAPATGVVTSNGTTVSSLSPTDSQILSASGTTPVYKTLIGGTNATIVNTPTSTTINVTTAASAAGSECNVQYNSGGTFSATSTLCYTSSTNIFSVNASSSGVLVGPSSTYPFVGVATSSVVASFTYTGSVASYTIPLNVTGTTLINLLGAGGNNTTGGSGGAGGSVTGTVASPTPGQVYYFFIGQQGGGGARGAGGSCSSGDPTAGTGGTSSTAPTGGIGAGTCQNGFSPTSNIFDGAGGSSARTAFGDAGGQASWISSTSTFSTSTVIAVAGGGGGAGGNGGSGSSAGGAGGGTTGSNGSAQTGGSGGGSGGGGGASLIRTTSGLTSTSTAASSNNGNGIITFSYTTQNMSTTYNSAPFSLAIDSHVIAANNSSTPTVVNGTLLGTDNSGFITTTLSSTTYTMTFGQIWAHNPPCGAWMASGTATYFQQIKSSTTTVIFTANTILSTSSIFQYQCGFGY